MSGVTLDCSPLDHSLACSAGGDEVAMTVPLWLLRQLHVHACTRVHTHVCVCVRAGVCPGVCSVHQRRTTPLQGASTLAYPLERTLQWKVGQLLPGAHALWLQPLLFSPLLGLTQSWWGGRSRCQTHFGTGDPLHLPQLLCCCCGCRCIFSPSCCQCMLLSPFWGSTLHLPSEDIKPGEKPIFMPFC